MPAIYKYTLEVSTPKALTPVTVVLYAPTLSYAKQKATDLMSPVAEPEDLVVALMKIEEC